MAATANCGTESLCPNILRLESPTQRRAFKVNKTNKNYVVQVSRLHSLFKNEQTIHTKRMDVTKLLVELLLLSKPTKTGGISKIEASRDLFG